MPPAPREPARITAAIFSPACFAAVPVMVPAAFDEVEAAVCAAFDAHPFVFDPAAPGPGLPVPGGRPVDPSYPVGPVELLPVCPELSAPPDNLLFGFLLLFPQLFPATPAWNAVRPDASRK